MHKIIKSRKGFTLIEMVLVIAIIVILASIVFFGVSGYLAKANTVKGVASVHYSKIDSVSSVIDANAGSAFAGT